MHMKSSQNIPIIAVLWLMLFLWSPLALALIEVQADCEQFPVDAKPETAPPTAGSVATKPSGWGMDEVAGTRVRVAAIKAFNGKGIVLESKLGGAHGQCSYVIFGSRGSSDNTVSGKVYAHFDWVTISAERGNVGGVTLKNAKSQQILTLMFSGKGQGLSMVAKDISVVAGNKTTELADVVELGKPVAVDVMLDLDQWSYEISVDGKKSADGALPKTDDNSFLNICFSTATSGISTFAIKNVIISPSPIKL